MLMSKYACQPEFDMYIVNKENSKHSSCKPQPKIGKSSLEMVNFRWRNDN